MRIAFIGKGGAGKTTTTSLFSLYLKSKNKPLHVFDADINMHMSEILLGKIFPEEKYLSNAENAQCIKKYLKGDNHRVKSMAEFRKTTPPTNQSGLIKLNDENNILAPYSLNANGIPVFAVGPHTTDKIGANCYHAKLEVLEAILNHTIDKDEIIVSDMVAGTDCFSCTLHMQFDLLVLVVEPTKQSVSVYNQFLELSEAAGIKNHLRVIANKITDSDDLSFIKKSIKPEHLLGALKANSFIKKLEQSNQVITQDIIDDEMLSVFDKTYDALQAEYKGGDYRYKKLLQMHKKYSDNDFIKDRFGDLARQIDPDYNFGKGGI